MTEDRCVFAETARMLRSRSMRAAWASLIGAFSAQHYLTWPLSNEALVMALLAAAYQFTVVYLAVFPLMCRAFARWGKPWAWVYVLASGLASFVGDVPFRLAAPVILANL